MGNNRLKIFYPVVFLTIVIVVASSLMIITEKVNRVALESRQDPETLALLQQIFPNAYFYAYSIDKEMFTLYNSSREKTGYAFYGQDYGYRSKITVLVGLEDKETIKNIIVISQYEDSAYWNMLVKNNFFDQFMGLKIEDCFPSYYWSSEGVNAVSGATISSNGVTNAVLDAILDKLEYLD